MTDKKNYLDALALIGEMRSRGILDEADYHKAEKYFVKKYGIKKQSVFRPVVIKNK